MRLKVALARRARRRRHRSPTSGRRPTGTSARCGTCSASTSRGHPHLRRILMPALVGGAPAAQGVTLARHRARAVRDAARSSSSEWQEDLRFKPEEWGLPTAEDDPTLMYLNIGPQHGATHGPLRVIVGLRDEEIVHCIPDIGYHHRGAEKMSERQTWHTFIPYTDRIDYLGGVINNLPWVLSRGEALRHRGARARAGHPRDALRVLPHRQPPRVLRHLRPGHRRALAGLLHVRGPRAHLRRRHRAHLRRRACTPTGSASAAWPRTCRSGWEQPVRDYLDYLPAAPRRVRPPRHGQPHHEGAHRGRRRHLSVDDAVEWGVTGANLRAAGVPWDWRKQRPYSDYERFDFDVPVGTTGDCYDRVAVRVEEMRQSLRIIRQCLDEHARRARTSRTTRWRRRRSRSPTRCTTSRRSSRTSSA